MTRFRFEVWPSEHRRITQRWQVKNTGSTPRGANYRLAVIDQSMGAPASMPLPPTVSGQVAMITLEHLAPVTLGVRRSTWQFFNPENQPIGEMVWTEIVVAVAPASAPRDLHPITRLPPAQPAQPGVAPDPITAASLGMIYGTHWLQVLQLPTGSDAQGGHRARHVRHGRAHPCAAPVLHFHRPRHKN